MSTSSLILPFAKLYLRSPTGQPFPQLYVEGELVGGCDITMELAENGELKKMVEQAANK